MLSEIQRLWKQSGYLAHFRILWVSTTWTLSESHRLYIFFLMSMVMSLSPDTGKLGFLFSKLLKMNWSPLFQLQGCLESEKGK